MKYVYNYIVIINLIVNFYKCLVLGYEVLVYIVWVGCNCLLFICVFVFWGMGICLELCLVDLIVNFYFVLLVFLGLGFEGIENKIEVLELIEINIYVMIVEECC